MDLLLADAAKTDRIKTEAPLLRAIVGIEMELRSGMAIDMTIETGNAEAWIMSFAIICGIEFLLGKRGHEHTQAIQLHWSENVFKEAKEIIDRNDFTLRDVAE